MTTILDEAYWVIDEVYSPPIDGLLRVWQDFDQLADLAADLKALADPFRLRLLSYLCWRATTGEAMPSVAEIAVALGAQPSLVSFHLSHLLRVKLVVLTKDKTAHRYAVNEEVYTRLQARLTRIQDGF